MAARKLDLNEAELAFRFLFFIPFFLVVALSKKMFEKKKCHFGYIYIDNEIKLEFIHRLLTLFFMGKLLL